MSQPFVGQLTMVGFNFASMGYAFCDGALMAIDQNQALYTLVGTTYGGDGQTTFALPNLQGRVAIHQGTSPSGTTYVMGQVGGVENVTVLTTQIPSHSHSAIGSSVVVNTSTPTNALLGVTAGNNYSTNNPGPAMSALTIANAGSNIPHNNLQPYLVINWLIALQGVFPSQN